MEHLLSARGLSAEIAAGRGVVNVSRRKSTAAGTETAAESARAGGTGAGVALETGSAGKAGVDRRIQQVVINQ